MGGETDGRWLGGSDRQPCAMTLSAFVGQKLGTFVATQSAPDLTALAELVDAGKVTPVIDRTYPLGGLPAAIRYLRQGRARGKVVICV
jgi:NADPH:quinone reductase-like Zn-dependent oxidoreductase